MIFQILAAAFLLLNNSTMASQPPAADKVPKKMKMHGDVRIDNYFWLRERENPKVLDYIKSENAYTDEKTKHTEVLREKLFQEIKERIQETDSSAPVKIDDYFYYSRTEEGKQYRIYCRKHGSVNGKEEILLDLNKLAEGKNFLSLAFIEPSPNHEILAYGIDEAGNESYKIYFKNLKNGELFSEVLEKFHGSFEWANDNKTALYSIHDHAMRPYRIYKHVLGTEPKKDILLYEEKDEAFTVGPQKTKNNRYIFIVSGSSISNEYHYIKTDNIKADTSIDKFSLFLKRKKGHEYDIDQWKDRFFILTNEGAKNFKVMWTPEGKTGKTNWKTLIPHRKEVKISGIEAMKVGLILHWRMDGLTGLSVFNPKTKKETKIKMPETVYTIYPAENPEYSSPNLRFLYTSMTTPRSVYDYEFKTKKMTLVKQDPVKGGYNPSHYETKRVWVKAHDGVRVPVSLVYKKGLKKDSKNPLWLYGYGSYGISIDPTFSSSRLSLLNRGFVFAIAHIRGGGELGEPWRDAGKLLKKKNTFKDFISVAEALIKLKYTSKEKLVISGGSAGGLLMGAVLNMRPDLFKAAIAEVPFVDSLNTMLDASLPLTVGEYDEWGNPNQKKFYDYMKSYAPYENVKKTSYPNILVEAGLNDIRVSYWEAAKWVAKLREYKTNSNLLLLKTNMGEGHSGPSGRYDQLKEAAFDYAFFLDVLGIGN